MNVGMMKIGIGPLLQATENSVPETSGIRFWRGGILSDPDTIPFSLMIWDIIISSTMSGSMITEKERGDILPCPGRNGMKWDGAE